MYREAYPESTLDGWPHPDELDRLASETDLPSLHRDSFKLLLRDLYDTNHRTLELLLRAHLESVGWISAT